MEGKLTLFSYSIQKFRSNLKYVTVHAGMPTFNTTPTYCLIFDKRSKCIFYFWSRHIRYFCSSWTVVVHRFDGSGDFERSWSEYRDGFGDVNGEAWLGNEYLHYVTDERSYMLRFDLEDWEGNTAYAEYSSFMVTPEVDEYRLLLGDYSGNASADADDDEADGFLHHHFLPFSTYDRENNGYFINCADDFGGFWWDSCGKVYITNSYCQSSECDSSRSGWRYSYNYGMQWRSWRGDRYSLKTMKMMIRPVDY